MGKSVGKRQLWRQIQRTVETELQSLAVINDEQEYQQGPQNSEHGIAVEDEISENATVQNVLSEDDESCFFELNGTEEVELDDATQLVPKELPGKEEQLRNWALDFNVSHNSLDKLLHILNGWGHELPLTARTLLNTPSSTLVKKSENGELCYFGLARGMKLKISSGLQCGSNEVSCNFSIDGVPIFNSSNLSF